MIELIALFPEAYTFEGIKLWVTADGTVTAWIILGTILALTGVGFPSPEDIPLMILGYVCWESGFFGTNPEGGFSFVAFGSAILFCATCNVIGDVTCFAAGRRWGMSLRNNSRLLRRWINDVRLARVEGWYERFGTGTVFVGRMVMGLRLVTFFFAGTMRMPYKKFIFWDYVGCFVSIPVWLTLGALLNENEEWIGEKLTSFKYGFIAFGVSILIAFIVYVKYFAKRKYSPKLAEDLKIEGETALLDKVHYDVNYQRMLEDDELEAARKRHASDRMTSTRLQAASDAHESSTASTSRKPDAEA